jgi:hypothetical protein
LKKCRLPFLSIILNFLDTVFWCLVSLSICYGLAEPESLRTLQSETGGNAWYKITCDGFGCIEWGPHEGETSILTFISNKLYT